MVALRLRELIYHGFAVNVEHFELAYAQRARSRKRVKKVLCAARITAREVRALQLQARHSISVVCGARITVCEVRAPQFGARVTAREVRALQLQARHSISVVCGARIPFREVRAPQLPACNSLVRRA